MTPQCFPAMSLRPTCPVCARNMTQTAITPVMFADGHCSYVAKFLCVHCHVETPRAIDPQDSMIAPAASPTGTQARRDQTAARCPA